MMSTIPENKDSIFSIFPSPVYKGNRDSNLDPAEEKEIEDIIGEEMRRNPLNSISNNSYIFDTKLKNLKEFCEEHIKIYVKEIISPKEELDFYITQSWLNITKPGEALHQHAHPNSIISGSYYVQTVEEDHITFYDPNSLPYFICYPFVPTHFNAFNSNMWAFPVEKNNLLLFPSWLQHGVQPNEKQTTDRISISFNTFAAGIFGEEDSLTKLVLGRKE